MAGLERSPDKVRNCPGFREAGGTGIQSLYLVIDDSGLERSSHVGPNTCDSEVVIRNGAMFHRLKHNGFRL